MENVLTVEEVLYNKIKEDIRRIREENPNADLRELNYWDKRIECYRHPVIMDVPFEES